MVIDDNPGASLQRRDQLLEDLRSEVIRPIMQDHPQEIDVGAIDRLLFEEVMGLAVLTLSAARAGRAGRALSMTLGWSWTTTRSDGCLSVRATAKAPLEPPTSTTVASPQSTPVIRI